MSKPKPTRIKELAGNPGKRPLNKNEPQFMRELEEDPPSDLSAEEKKLWKHIYQNAPEGLYKSVDTGNLRIYVTAFCLHKKARKMIKKEGAVILSANSGVAMKNPWVDILNQQATLMMKAGSNLGLSPVDRSKIALENGVKKPESRFGHLHIVKEKEKVTNINRSK